MTIYNLLLQQPEAPISEKWVWNSDVMVSDNGKEQRMSLSPVPRRAFSGTFAFSTEDTIRRHIATMQAKFGNVFDWPVWQDMVKAKLRVVAGTNNVRVNVRRSNFRQGGKFLIVEGSKYETGVVLNVLADRITSTTNFVNSYSERAIVIPITQVYNSSSATVVRRAHNQAATSSFGFVEYNALNPFVAEADLVPFVMHKGLPVVDRIQRGDEYSQTLITGMEPIDFGGQPSIRNRWLDSEWQLPFTFLSDRLHDPEDFYFWKTFADYARGSTQPFYVPQHRNDLHIKDEAIAGGNQVNLIGDEYHDNFYPSPKFREIAIISEAGNIHCATVTQCNQFVNSDGTKDDFIKFDPPLPAGDWQGQTIGFLLKCRIADDTVSIEHRGVSSLITLNGRTVP